MKQKFIDGILYFQELEPQYIDTDAAVVYVQKELVNEFKKLNKRRLFDIEPFNYKVLTSKKPFWYVDEEEEQEQLVIDNLFSYRWVGNLDSYYQVAWGDKFNNISVNTIWKFNPPQDYDYHNLPLYGTGYEVDYDPNNFSNYEYTLFDWVVRNGDIYINYRNEEYNTIRIDYRACSFTNGYFVSTLFDNEDNRINFSLEGIEDKIVVVSQKEINAPAEGGIYTIYIISSRAITFISMGFDNEEVNVEIQNNTFTSILKTMNITIPANLQNESRITFITLEADGPCIIKITQDAV